MRPIIFVLLVVFSCTTAVFAGSFKDNGDGTVTDLTTNLMWQQCSAGHVEADCSIVAGSGTYLWENAISYCEGSTLGGFADWRLPNVKELNSIVDTTKAIAPAISTTYFPNTRSLHYWSSTSYAPNVTMAWSVQFSYGFVGNLSKSSSHFVRCVRGGQ